MATDLGSLYRSRGVAAWNAVRSLGSQSSLKIIVILVFGAALWIGLYLAIMDSFHYFAGDQMADLKEIILPLLLAVFFLSLLVLLTFSNGIIAYGSLFRSEETAFLFAQPVSRTSVFVYKLSESLVFSSWAFLFLGLPLIVAYGVDSGAPWWYYPGAAVVFGLFAVIPCAAGGIFALLATRYLSRSPRRLVILAAGTLLLVLVAWGMSLIRSHTERQDTEMDWFNDAIGQLGVSQNPLLPSYWAGQALENMALSNPNHPNPKVSVAAGANLRKAGYRMLLLLSTSLFAGMVCARLARRMYEAGYYRVQTLGRRRRVIARNGFYGTVEAALGGMRLEMRELLVKDLKSFLRDPVQWSQMLLFFGLLGVYFVNIRSMGYDLDSPRWKNLISLLNLVATSLTLSTFTSRFIFPLLSLEGRRFWVLGLLPISRRSVLLGKFFFALLGSLAISLALMLLSDAMLRAPAEAMFRHAGGMALICAGLAALAVGIGALYPNLREDNPSKIVSGFGGTLNLVLSLFYVMAIVALVAVPYHAREMRMLPTEHAAQLATWADGAALLLCALVVALPLWLGSRAFEKLEV